MKPNPRGVTAATTRPSANWFSAIFCAAFLSIISASAAVSQTDTEGMNPAEKWVVAQATAGEIADLTEKFPQENDRKLGAHFLENLLTRELPHRHGVRINGAIIDEAIDLSNAQIPFQVSLDQCRFNKNVAFAHANFMGGLSFDGSRFKKADFIHMKVRGDAAFADATFEGRAEFFAADIAGDFSVARSKFQNKQRAASFIGMKVGGSAYFTAAVFKGPLFFLFADIANDLYMQSAGFQNTAGVSFWGMKVGRDAHFDSTVFDGWMDFRRTDIIGNLSALKTRFQNKQQPATFHSTKIGGDAVFGGARFEGPPDLRYADFGLLDLSNASWPKVAPQIQMQGMSYKHIRAVAENEPKSHRALLELADQSPYTADVYTNLEAFFLRQGYRADADRAFIAGKLREREQYSPEGRGVREYVLSSDWLRWLGSTMLYLLVGFGRRPWQAAIPCAGLVAIGCILFSPKKMEPQKPEDTPRVYSRFWYSLGLFLPFVDLQADKVWKPKTDQIFLRNYMRVHILLGWILVPLVLAALTGLIK